MRFELCEIQGQLKLGYNSNAYIWIAKKFTLNLADKINSVSFIFRLGLLHLATKEVGRARKANPQNQWSWTLTMNIYCRPMATYDVTIFKRLCSQKKSIYVVSCVPLWWLISFCLGIKYCVFNIPVTNLYYLIVVFYNSNGAI